MSNETGRVLTECSFNHVSVCDILQALPRTGVSARGGITMKKMGIKLIALFSVVILLAGFNGCTASVVNSEPVDTDNSTDSIKPVITEKELPCYILDPETQESLPVFFIGDSDVPYVSLEDWAELYTYMLGDYDYDTEEMVSFVFDYSIEGDVAVLTRKDGDPYTMTVDCEKDTITFFDYDAFIRLSENAVLIDMIGGEDSQNENDHILFKRVPGSYERYGNELVLNAGDYGIDFVAEGDACYVPLQTLCDFLLAPKYVNVFYNSEAVVFAPYSGVLDDDTGEPTKLGEKIYSTETKEISEDMGKFSYAELCLAFDKLYGLKDIHGIENFDELADRIGVREQLSGTDTDEADSALYSVIAFHLDDLHSCFLAPSPFSETVKRSTLEEEVGYGRSDNAFSRQVHKFEDARKLYYPEGVPFYEEIGNTAYITFDEFKDIPEGVDYYEAGPSAEAEDTIGIMIYAYSRIMREDSPIENVVLDLSNNIGGDANTAIFVISSFLGEGYGSVENTMTGALATGVYNVDINLDGKFDENDWGLVGKKLFCLISPVSFSCGNLVPNVFKNSHEVTLIGQTSGGGSCIVLPMTTACGTCFQLSGPKRLAFTKNGSFYDIDRGADPDYILSYPEDYYERESLTEYINTLR